MPCDHGGNSLDDWNGSPFESEASGSEADGEALDSDGAVEGRPPEGAGSKFKAAWRESLKKRQGQKSAKILQEPGDKAPESDKTLKKLEIAASKIVKRLPRPTPVSTRISEKYEQAFTSPETLKKRQERAKKRQENASFRQKAESMLQEARELPAETLINSFLGKLPEGVGDDEPAVKAVLGCAMAGLASYPSAALLAKFPNALIWRQRLSESSLAGDKAGLALVLEYSRRALYGNGALDGSKGGVFQAYGLFGEFVEAVLLSARKRELDASRSSAASKPLPAPASRELFARLLDRVGGLAEPERLPFALFCHFNFPANEIAKIMGAPKSSVQDSRFRCLDSVNKCLDEYLSPFVTVHLAALERYQPLASLLKKIRDYMINQRIGR